MQVTKTGSNTLSAKKLEIRKQISTLIRKIGNPEGTGVLHKDTKEVLQHIHRYNFEEFSDKDWRDVQKFLKTAREIIKKK